jgi:hypothetical protein
MLKMLTAFFVCHVNSKNRKHINGASKTNSNLMARYVGKDICASES